MNVLVDHKLIIRDFYVVGGKSYCYRINPNLVKKVFLELASKKLAAINNISNASYINILASYSNIQPLPLCSSVDEKNSKKGNKTGTLSNKKNKYQKWFESDFKKLKIDFNQLNSILEERLNKIDTDTNVVYSLYPRLQYKVLGNGDKYYFNKYFTGENILSLANKLNYSVIQTKRGLYLDDLTNYKIKKVISIYSADKMSLERLKSRCLRANRNETNKRLDTNFTNLPSEYFKYICKQNNLVQLDLCNSQFCFLSLWLTQFLDSDDFKLFKYLSNVGELYDFVERNLGLDSRQSSKDLMFYIIFSPPNSIHPKSDELEKLFPNVLNFIESYKRKIGYKTFCINLQKMESEFFIDVVYSKIKNHKMLCFTKHDSIIIQSKNVDEVMKIITEEMKTIGLGGKFIEKD
jgi:hypothetical protein